MARTIHWNSLTNSLQKYVLSDLFWNEHKTRLTCLGKIAMGSIPMRLRKGFWWGLWAIWWEWSALLRLFMRKMIRRVKIWRIQLKLVMTGVQNDCTHQPWWPAYLKEEQSDTNVIDALNWQPCCYQRSKLYEKRTCKHRSYNKVNRCAQQQPTNQPAGHQMNSVFGPKIRFLLFPTLSNWLLKVSCISYRYHEVKSAQMGLVLFEKWPHFPLEQAAHSTNPQNVE